MKVEILTDIFLAEALDEDIDRLWHTIEGKHSWIIKDLDTYDAIINSSWYSTISGSKRKAIDDFMAFSLQTSKSHALPISNRSSEYFSIKESIKYLEQPFLLILENSLNDAPFFDSLIKHFPHSEKLKKHKDERWFQYDMGGGSTIVHNLSTKMRSFKGIIFTKRPFEYLRCFVIIDSDRKYPNEELKQATKDLIEFLDSNKVPYHVLEKREMENYLPDEAFSEITHNRAFVDAYLNLTPIQKDYFDIEKGFNLSKFDKLPLEVQNFYTDLDDKGKAIFRSENLKKINNSARENFKSKFPMFFLSDKINKKHFLKRCSHHSKDVNQHPYNPNELPDLLIQISNLL